MGFWRIPIGTLFQATLVLIMYDDSRTADVQNGEKFCAVQSEPRKEGENAERAGPGFLGASALTL